VVAGKIETNFVKFDNEPIKGEKESGY